MRLVAIVLLSSLAAMYGHSAAAQIITTPDLDNLCRSAPALTHRVTTVYVDVSSIKRGENEWGNTILSKLELAPRERISVIGVDPNTFETFEVFDSCYPALTKTEIEAIGHSRGWWSKLTQMDPESQQRENLETFNARLGNALDKLLARADGFKPGKRRNVLGAIAVDKSRFNEKGIYHRIIIYTAASVQDELEGASDEAKVLEVMLGKYPANFSGAQVFVFGVSGTDSVPLELRQRLFSNFLLQSWARVHSFSQSLPQQKNELYPLQARLSGTFEGGGTKGNVQAIFAEGEPAAPDSWLTFTVGNSSLYVPFQSEYTCNSERCTLSGTVVENIPPLVATPFFRRGDRLTLKGKDRNSLVGDLKSDSKEVFQGGKDEAKYTISFVR